MISIEPENTNRVAARRDPIYRVRGVGVGNENGEPLAQVKENVVEEYVTMRQDDHHE